MFGKRLAVMRGARRRRLALVGLLGAAALALAACAGSGAGGAGNPESQAVDFERALAGAPPELEALYGRGGLVEGGTDGFQAQLRRLRGHPVVVNKWASWCGPCRAEFPFFQRLVAERGKEIAFVGINSNDSDDAARTFLEEFPVPYPSFKDPGHKIGDLLQNAREFPTTGFYDSKGELVFVHRGGYSNADQLEADIDRYAR